MAKDKKSKKAKADGAKPELIAGPGGDSGKAKKKDRKAKPPKKDGGLDQLLKIADHPLVGDLLAVGALAAVAAIAEAGKGDSAKMKSSAAVKAAGKAAAAAIGARLLKEVGNKDSKKEAKS